jgi:hypothetical protein
MIAASDRASEPIPGLLAELGSSNRAVNVASDALEPIAENTASRVAMEGWVATEDQAAMADQAATVAQASSAGLAMSGWRERQL